MTRARPPDYPRIDPIAAFASLAKGLHELRATGILASLDDERAQRLLSGMLAPRFSDDLFSSLVETHLRDAPGNDIVLHMGDWWSAAHLETVMRRSFANVLWDDEHAREHVHLVARGCMRPSGPSEWLAIYEAALAHVGDARRFVSVAVSVQPDERMYLLVTETQARVLAKHRLVARGTANRRLPPVIPGREATPPSVQALVEALRRKGVGATASGARIVVALELPGGGRLVDRVKADLERR